MFENLEQIRRRPEPYQFYSTPLLWNDEHISKKMLEVHLDGTVDLASRNHGFIDNSVDWIVSRFGIGPQSKICDFGCGPGLYTSRLASRGARVTGVDFSDRSIEYARNNAKGEKLEIDYVLQDYLEFSMSEEFDLITLIYYDFCPLSSPQRKKLLAIINKHLKRDGALLLDVLSLNHYDKTIEEKSFDYSPRDGFWSADPYYVFRSTFKYEREKVTVDKYSIFEATRSREIYNWLQCYSLESLRSEFAENGFQIVEYYSDVAGAPYDSSSTGIAVVAKKLIE